MSNQNQCMLNQNSIPSNNLSNINQQTPQIAYKISQSSILSSENKENVQYHSNTQTTNSMKKSSAPLMEQQSNTIQENNGSRYQLQNEKHDPSTQNISNGIISDNALSFLNDYTSFTQKKEKEPPQLTQPGEDLNALREKYETLVNQILTEEKEYIESHKSHIDEMVGTMKNEMNLINTVEKQANVIIVYFYKLESILYITT